MNNDNNNNNNPIPDRKPHLTIISKEKRTCHLVNFALPADQRKKKKAKIYLDLVRVLKNCDGVNNCS